MRTITLRIESPRSEPFERVAGSTPLVVGRAPDADVVCTDTSMSRHHARVLCDGSDFFIEDLGARNGTYVNGTLVTRAQIGDGDVIRMGDTHIRVSDPSGATNARPVDVIGSGQLGSSIFRSLAEIAHGDHGGTFMDDAAPARVAARLKALNEFHRALAEAISLEQLLQRLFDQLFTALHPEEGVILLRRADGTLRTAASRRLPGATGDLLVSQRLSDEVVNKNTAALVTDVASDERFAAAESVIGAGIRSILAAPFTDAHGCLGMVAIYSRTNVRRFGEEDLELLVSLASAAALRIRNVELADAAAARRVQDRELALAREIQMGMLPRGALARADVTIGAALIPARAVGGDIYDYFVSGDTLWFTIADAAGKGVSAALIMTMTRTLFRATAQSAADVASVMARMNVELARDNEAQIFVTAIVGRLDLQSGELTWCNAGHPPPLRASRGVVSAMTTEPGIALGILPEATYAESQVRLDPGETLLLYTDGVTDAIDEGSGLFGDARLLETFKSAARGDVGQAVQTIVDAVGAFAGGVPQEDDITLLALRRASS